MLRNESFVIRRFTLYAPQEFNDEIHVMTGHKGKIVTVQETSSDGRRVGVVSLDIKMSTHEDLDSEYIDDATLSASIYALAAYSAPADTLTENEFIKLLKTEGVFYALSQIIARYDTALSLLGCPSGVKMPSFEMDVDQWEVIQLEGPEADLVD